MSDINSGYRFEIIQILESFYYSDRFKLKFDGCQGVYKSTQDSIIADFDFLNRLVRVEFNVSGALKILSGIEYIKDVMPVLYKIKSLYLERKQELDSNQIEYLFMYENWCNFCNFLAKKGFNAFDIPSQRDGFKAFLNGLDKNIIQEFIRQDNEVQEYIKRSVKCL